MEDKRNSVWLRAGVCLLACLLCCGCGARGENIKENASAVVGAENVVWEDMAEQLLRLQEQLAAIDRRYQELQAQLTPPTETGKEEESEKEESSLPKEEPTPSQNSLYAYQITEGGIVLTRYLGAESNVTVPGAIDGMRVIGLSDRAFADTAVRTVVLPNTVKSVGWFAFYGCTNLEQVVIPASVESIGYASFDGCSSALTLLVKQDSYAQKFAASFALRYVVQ